MRKDLAKLTTEAPRRGSGYAETKKYGGRVRIVHDPDHTYDNEKGGFHSSARNRQWNHKGFSDSLNPLEGTLRKNVGRPWDDIYSEFCEVLDRRGVSGYHIWTHLMRDFVKVRGIYEAGGKIWEYQAGVFDDRKKYDYTEKRWVDNPDGKLRLACDTLVTGFYVHPRTGILCYQGREKYGKEYLGNPYRDHHWRYREYKPVVVETLNNSDGSYFKLEECGRSPKSKFKAWFYYHTTTKTVYEPQYIPDGAVESYRFSGLTIYESPKIKESNYAFNGVEVVQMHYYILKPREITKSTKRSCNRKQMAIINERLAKLRVL